MSVIAFLDVPTVYAQHAASALVRLALHPLARLQARGEKLRGRLAPQLEALLAVVGLIGFRRPRQTVDPAAPGASVLPYLSFGTVLFAAFVPLSAGLYLLTTTGWTLVERALLRS